MEDFRTRATNAGAPGDLKASEVYQAMAELSQIVVNSGQTPSATELGQVAGAINGLVYNHELLFIDDEPVVLYDPASRRVPPNGG